MRLCTSGSSSRGLPVGLGVSFCHAQVWSPAKFASESQSVFTCTVLQADNTSARARARRIPRASGALPVRDELLRGREARLAERLADDPVGVEVHLPVVLV